MPEGRRRREREGFRKRRGLGDSETAKHPHPLTLRSKQASRLRFCRCWGSRPSWLSFQQRPFWTLQGVVPWPSVLHDILFALGFPLRREKLAVNAHIYNTGNSGGLGPPSSGTWTCRVLPLRMKPLQVSCWFMCGVLAFHKFGLQRVGCLMPISAVSTGSATQSCTSVPKSDSK